MEEITSALRALVYNQRTTSTTRHQHIYAFWATRAKAVHLKTNNILKIVKAHKSLSNAATELEELSIHISMREY